MARDREFASFPARRRIRRAIVFAIVDLTPQAVLSGLERKAVRVKGGVARARRLQHTPQSWLNGAAPESNRASRGLHDLTGFEDRLGHRARPLRSNATASGVEKGRPGGNAAKRGREPHPRDVNPTPGFEQAYFHPVHECPVLYYQGS
jgi:hypothetical protein